MPGATLASSFTVRELTGPKRVIVLRTRALPYPPYPLSGEQRNSITWYPGNSTATLQVLGPSEDPSSIHGMWKDRFLGPGLGAVEPPAATVDGVPVLDAMSLVETFDDVRRLGQELEVTWDVTARRGILQSFKAEFDRRQDITWSMSFLWLSQGEADVPPVFPTTLNLGDLRGTFNAQLDALGTLSPPPLPVVSSVRQALSGALSQLSSAVSAIQGVIDVVTAGVSTALAAAQRAAAIMDSVISASQLVIDVVNGRPPVALLQGVLPGEATLGQVLAVASWASNLTAQARETQRLGANQRQEITGRVEGQVITPYRVRQGEDLRTIALRFFGRAEDWRQIALFNQLSSSSPVAGTLIMIPRPRSEGAS